MGWVPKRKSCYWNLREEEQHEAAFELVWQAWCLRLVPGHGKKYESRYALFPSDEQLVRMRRTGRDSLDRTPLALRGMISNFTLPFRRSDESIWKEKEA